MFGILLIVCCLQCISAYTQIGPSGVSVQSAMLFTVQCVVKQADGGSCANAMRMLSLQWLFTADAHCEF